VYSAKAIIQKLFSRLCVISLSLGASFLVRNKLVRPAGSKKTEREEKRMELKGGGM